MDSVGQNFHYTFINGGAVRDGSIIRHVRQIWFFRNQGKNGCIHLSWNRPQGEKLLNSHYDRFVCNFP